MVIEFTRRVAREQSWAGVRAGGRKAQSAWQYYASMGNMGVFEMVWSCWVALRRDQEYWFLFCFFMAVSNFMSISFYVFCFFCVMPCLNNSLSFCNCRIFWVRPTVLSERWLDHWAVARKKLLGE